MSFRKILSSNAKKREKVLAFGAYLANVGVFVFLLGSVFSLSVFAYYSYTIPAPDKLTNRKIEQSTKIYDRNGKLLYNVHGDKNRTVVGLDYVSPHVVNATLAAEDADFYRHRGFDPPGIIRAGYKTLSGQDLQGASTVTQQLIKNALLTTNRTVERKIKELILSVQIEEIYPKEEILQYYLNETPYGSTAYGIEAASQLYFNKTASELNLAESAYLAGLPQAPSRYSPYGSTPERGKERQETVLRLMKDRGWITPDGQRKTITQEEYEEAINYELQFEGRQDQNINAPHFVFYVLDKLYEKYGEEYVKNSGLEIKTTLDLTKQQKIQTIVQEELEKAQHLNVGNSAVVAIDPDSREILTMVGSRDYFDKRGGQFNAATSPSRQPGSSIKPLVYATGLKQGYTASTVIMDVPTTFDTPKGSEPYEPRNYDGTFRGPIQVRPSLANSINISAVKMTKLVGVDSVINTANEFGIGFDKDKNYYGLSIGLGGGEASLVEMTNAYAVFGSGGIYQEPISILSIKDKEGNEVESNYTTPQQRVLDEGISFIISDILSDDAARLLAFGPGNLLEVGPGQVAAKTGTTDEIRDNWTIGYTNGIVVGVWAGNNDNSPMNKQLASGITGAAPIWNRSIQLYLDENNPSNFVPPENVVRSRVGTITGGKPAAGLEEQRWEYFIKGTQPEVRSDMVVELEVCEEDDKIANDDCKEDDNTEKREYIELKALLPQWQDEVDSWVEENYPEDEEQFKKFHPPTEKSDYEKDDDDDDDDD